MRKLLVANRGEIARRVFRTARAMGLQTVAVYSDADAGAPFVRDADEAVRIGGAAPSESYLRIDAIIGAAARTGADAIHPGYGFLAENAAFARACADTGVTFVGPTPEAIDAMGSKLAAKRLLADAGVPVLPDVEDPARAADEVGFPLLVKPSAGGGGKGMRIVRSASELDGAVAASRREAAGAFGDDTLLLERYVDSGRHVEIQILGDTHGNVIHLGERECSIQRRHQKILEESPSVAVDDALRAQMGDAAVAAGRAIGYVGAGTVEFLVDSKRERASAFYFLEVNTRLQVEHPVTEEVLGIDLVRAQLEIAAGGHVPAVPATRGHAIEVRLYAEDPAADFLPQTGVLSHLRIPDRVRVDAGVESGSEISIHYDPMIAKVIAYAPTRTAAAGVLAGALREAEIDGLKTNREFLVRLLEHPAFLAGEFDTGFLEHHDLSEPLLDEQDRRACAAAAALAAQARRRAGAQVQPTIPSGWRNNPSVDQLVEFDAGREHPLAVRYRFIRGILGALSVDGEPLPDAVAHEIAHDAVDLSVGGVRRRYRVRSDGDRVEINIPAGQCSLRALDRFPDAAGAAAAGSLLAPMPGKVIRVDAAPGDEVAAGQPLLVLEAMKMEHEIVAPAAGVLTSLPVSVGDQVDAGTLLAAIEGAS
ncbi:MAG TPA: biotin carboxylase N-terminal domain-containing protein [Solirubrobacteraceae bacterium]|nr:biotin carboxylase N-terminal domain-containing protein [Solirubrobacteraceae bacterium]